MASRWIRWNTASHIFEHSTDSGANWDPLPLDASTLTEGSLADARLSANVPLKDGANVFTNAVPVSLESAAPILQFKETDGVADAKHWRFAVEGAAFKFQKLTDALAATDLFTVNRDGQLVYSPAVAGYAADISGASIGMTQSRIRNSNNSATSGAGFYLGNDIGTIGELKALASSFTTSGADVAGGLTLKSSGAGGLNINASDASGQIQLFTGGSTSARLRLTASGNAVFSGSIFEQGRSSPIGQFSNVTYSAANFVGFGSQTWTVDAADQTEFAYCLIGKTLIVTFDLRSTTVGGTPNPYLVIAMPTGVCADYCYNPVWVTDNGTKSIGVAQATPGSSNIFISKVDESNWSASANNTWVRGQIAISLA